MLHIVKVSLALSALLALWAALLKADLPSDQYQLVLYVSAGADRGRGGGGAPCGGMPPAPPADPWPTPG